MVSLLSRVKSLLSCGRVTSTRTTRSLWRQSNTTVGIGIAEIRTFMSASVHYDRSCLDLFCQRKVESTADQPHSWPVQRLHQRGIASDAPQRQSTAHIRCILSTPHTRPYLHRHQQTE